jgi:CRISPR/Cas system-associated exonuclease Cas4 (RecB family)
MPEGLYVSVSQLKAWLRCSQAYFYKYVLGAEPEFLPVALAFGSAFHQALASYYTEVKMSGAPLALDHVQDVFRDAWERQVSGPVPLQSDDDQDEVAHVDKAMQMLAAFHTSAEAALVGHVVEGVELGFTVDLHDPDRAERLDEQLVGSMDLVLRGADGTRIVVEHKSAAKRYTPDQLVNDIQLTAYSLAAKQLGLGDVRLQFQVVTKTKAPTVQREFVQRSTAEEREFERMAVLVLRAIDNGVFFPVRGPHCRTCPFQRRCESERAARARVVVVP